MSSFAREGIYKCEIYYRSLLQNIASFHIQRSKCLCLNVEWPLLLAKVYTNVRSIIGLFCRILSLFVCDIWYNALNAASACISRWGILFCSPRCIHMWDIWYNTFNAASAWVLQFGTGWRRFIGGLKLQVIFGKRATNYRALLRKMTYKDKASYVSSVAKTHTHTHTHTHTPVSSFARKGMYIHVHTCDLTTHPLWLTKVYIYVWYNITYSTIYYRSLLQNIVSFHIQRSKCLCLNVEWPLLLSKVYTNVRSIIGLFCRMLSLFIFNAASVCVSMWSGLFCSRRCIQMWDLL